MLEITNILKTFLTVLVTITGSFSESPSQFQIPNLQTPGGGSPGIAILIHNSGLLFGQAMGKQKFFDLPKTPYFLRRSFIANHQTLHVLLYSKQLRGHVPHIHLVSESPAGYLRTPQNCVTLSPTPNLVEQLQCWKSGVYLSFLEFHTSFAAMHTLRKAIVRNPDSEWEIFRLEWGKGRLA